MSVRRSVWKICTKRSQQLGQLLYSRVIHALLIVCMAFMIAPSAIWAQDASSSPTVTAESQPKPDRPPFALGVSVSDSPGSGVLVKSVAWRSPADRAGIKSGDFLMAIDDKSIESPDDLHDQLQNSAAEKHLGVTVWRQGEMLTKTVEFDPKFSDSARKKAWLGVMLQMTQGGDVLIADVMPASPAKESGIRIGDTIVRMNAENIDSVDELMQIMKKIRSGDNVEVTVLRNGEEQTFTVRVGTAVQRTMRWFEDRIPFDRIERWRDSVPEVEVERYSDSLERMLNRLRNEVRYLRDEVDRIRTEEREEPQADPADDDSTPEKRVTTIDTSF